MATGCFQNDLLMCIVSRYSLLVPIQTPDLCGVSSLLSSFRSVSLWLESLPSLETE